MRAPSLTVGIEEEYQIIDPVTREVAEETNVSLRDRSPSYCPCSCGTVW